MGKRSVNIITVADLKWQNGLEFALQGVKLALEQGVNLHYLIIGEGPLYEALGFTIYDMAMCETCQIRKKWNPFFKPDIALYPAIVPGMSIDHRRMRSNIHWITTYPNAEMRKVTIIPRWDPRSIGNQIKTIAESLDENHGN